MPHLYQKQNRKSNKICLSLGLIIELYVWYKDWNSTKNHIMTKQNSQDNCVSILCINPWAVWTYLNSGLRRTKSQGSNFWLGMMKTSPNNFERLVIMEKRDELDSNLSEERPMYSCQKCVIFTILLHLSYAQNDCYF